MFNAAANMIDLGALVVLIIIACIVVCAWCFIIFYLCTHASMFIAFLTTNEPQSNELRLETRVGCGDGTCYLPMFARRYKDRVFKRLGYFPSIIALASVSKTYRKRVRGRLELIGDGMAHFERSNNERPVWDVVEELVGKIGWVGTNELRIVSSVPPEGYRYIQLFLPEWRNFILLLGPNPRLQAIIDIDASYRTQFIGVLWKKETDRYCLEKVLYMDVWGQLSGMEFGEEARIN